MTPYSAGGWLDFGPFRDQRERLADPAFLGIYLVVPLLFAQAGDLRALTYVPPIIAVVAFVAWLLSLRRVLTIGALPTSKIASAAQGYVELGGRALAHPGGALRSRFNALPCVWYRYVVEEKTRDGKWRQIESGRSDDSFLLDDGSGQCLVDPEYAEILPGNSETRMNGYDIRCTESLILPGDTVCAIGEFSTIGGASADLDLESDIGELLATWKKNRPALLARFDLDKDGEISEKEWFLARSQARRETRKAHSEIRSQPGTHVLHKPRDGRIFLISNVDARQLRRRYALWAWLHLGMLLAAVCAGAWMRLG
ncbi:MAG TPA: hypothetical protein VHB46_06930 [Burkholderiales bacterium]|nr:hypothetical protein [Burkholderiales bacterium]